MLDSIPFYTAVGAYAIGFGGSRRGQSPHGLRPVQLPVAGDLNGQIGSVSVQHWRMVLRYALPLVVADHRGPPRDQRHQLSAYRSEAHYGSKLVGHEFKSRPPFDKPLLTSYFVARARYPAPSKARLRSRLGLNSCIRTPLASVDPDQRSWIRILRPRSFQR